MATTHIETHEERREWRDTKSAIRYVTTFTLTYAAMWWFGSGRHPVEDVVFAALGAGMGSMAMHSLKKARRERRRRRGLWPG